MSACTVRRPVFLQGHAAWLGVILVVLPWPGCAGPAVVPPELATQVKRDVTFSEVSAEPGAYKGQVVLAGGMVLSAKLLKDGTRIVVLQLPLDSSLEPSATLAETQGRFLAVHPGFLDPATLPTGTRITVVGEVMGASTLPLDDTTYT